MTSQVVVLDGEEDLAALELAERAAAAARIGDGAARLAALQRAVAADVAAAAPLVDNIEAAAEARAAGVARGGAAACEAAAARVRGGQLAAGAAVGGVLGLLAGPVGALAGAAAGAAVAARLDVRTADPVRLAFVRFDRVERLWEWGAVCADAVWLGSRVRGQRRAAYERAMAQRWEPDDAAGACRVCSYAFDAVARRRHHCRQCGALVCDACSQRRAPVPLPEVPGFAEPVRVCEPCWARRHDAAT